MTTSTSRDCLVCGHTEQEHDSVDAVCTGTDGLCQCHDYNPDQHPAERIAARRDQGQ